MVPELKEVGQFGPHGVFAVEVVGVVVSGESEHVLLQYLVAMELSAKENLLTLLNVTFIYLAVSNPNGQHGVNAVYLVALE